jgi:hypothetical protein
MAADCLGQAEVVALAGACASAQCRNGAREPALEPCSSAELIILILAPIHGHRLQESPHEPGSWARPRVISLWKVSESSCGNQDRSSGW